MINLIRNSESAQAARQQLIARFGLDDDQAQAILDMQLRRLAALEREQLEKEYQEIQESIRKMEDLAGRRQEGPGRQSRRNCAP